MRSEIVSLIAQGTLPSESAPVSEIALWQDLVQNIAPPVTLPEAVALAGILGADNCFGLAWSVVHLVESAPGWNAEHVPAGSSPFLLTLRTRANNALKSAGLSR